MRKSAGYCIGMAMTAVGVVVFILVAVTAAELVRMQCRRMLAPPARRPAAAPKASAALHAVSRAAESVQPAPATAAFAPATAA